MALGSSPQNTTGTGAVGRSRARRSITRQAMQAAQQAATTLGPAVAGNPRAAAVVPGAATGATPASAASGLNPGTSSGFRNLLPGAATMPAAQTVAPVVAGPGLGSAAAVTPGTSAAAAAQATRGAGFRSLLPAAPSIPAMTAPAAAGTASPAISPAMAAAGQAVVPMAAAPGAGTAAASAAAPTGLRGMFAAGGRFGPATIGRAGLYGGAGILGSSLVRGATGNQDGTWDDALVNATAGAGIGAGIGSLIPGVGTAIGAGVGAGGGALWGLLRGGDSTETASTRELDKQTTRLNQMFDNYGVSADLRDQLNMQLALTAEGRPPAEVRVLADEIRASAVGLISQDKEMQKQDAARAGALAAVQGWMGPMMQTQIDAANVYAQDLSLAMTEAAKNLPTEALREAALAQAARVPLDTATQNAYALQQAAFGAYQYDMASQQAAMQAILGLSGQVGGAVPGMQNGGGVDPAALFDPSASLMPTG